MMYTAQEIIDYCAAEDVKFIRLAFCDVFGLPKNISIMPEELSRAFSDGISFDASAINGFGDEAHSDLLLFPDGETLTVLPWRPSHGRVVRLFADIRRSDGSLFSHDTRNVLKRTIAAVRNEGVAVNFGTEFEFYLFRLDADGNATNIPYDKARYMDIAPLDRGENVRREICLTLCEMGIRAESSHHEDGPGQNEIDFRYGDALHAADNAITFPSVVRTIAMQNGLWADFSPKPLPNESGNGMHINLSLASPHNENTRDAFMAGLMEHICEITAFLNPVDASYARLGEHKAPRYVTWSPENRSQLIRIPAAKGEYERIELRSPDPACNPYLAFALILAAGADGVRRNLTAPLPTNVNLFAADASITSKLRQLPHTRAEAVMIAKDSEFVRSVLPAGIVEAYTEDV
ncbi:MAG: type I glutamate--ammonia ligase [Clostridiales bacterium]|nr:type I glutamate--ammonia ligase [Clostridiales bacterium]